MACGDACPKGCINFIKGRDGFLFPSIDQDLCIGCKACQRVCPTLSPVATNDVFPKSFAAWASKEVRKDSASGGVFYALAHTVIQQGGYVSGAVFDGRTVKHIITNKIDELKRIQGTKYFQSNTQGVYKQIKHYLKEGKRILFSGTSCQVAGLLSVVGSKNENLITIDLICYGVPSPLTIEAEERIRGKSLRRIISSRDKNHKGGWKNCYYMTCDWDDGTQTVSSPNDSFMLGAFNSGKAMRISCYHCLYKNIKRQADLTIGDYHNVKGFEEEMTDGISLVLTHTAQGLTFLNSTNELTLHERPLAECLNGKRTIYYNDSIYRHHPMREMMPWMLRHAPIWLLNISYKSLVKSKNPLVWPFTAFDLLYRELNQKKANIRLKQVLNQINVTK